MTLKLIRPQGTARSDAWYRINVTNLENPNYKKKIDLNNTPRLKRRYPLESIKYKRFTSKYAALCWNCDVFEARRAIFSYRKKEIVLVYRHRPSRWNIYEKA
jgi:hypothetical protein